MEKIILIMIGLIIATIGVMCVFDARIITKKYLDLEIKMKDQQG